MTTQPAGSPGTEKSWDDILKTGKYSLSDPDPWVVQKLVDFQKISAGPYLDLGCGLGRHLEPFGSRQGISLGLDCAFSAVGISKKRGNPPLSVIQASMTCIPFKDESFGTVLAWRSIYLLRNKEIDKSIEEVYRILKNNGRFLCSIRSTSNTLYHVGLEIGEQIEPGTFKYPEHEFRGAVYHFFSSDEILDRFSAFKIHDLHSRELAHTAFTVNRPEYKNDFWVFWAEKK